MSFRRWIVLLCLGAVWSAGPFAGAPASAAPSVPEIAATLDRFHAAASAADGPTYFSLFAPEGIFIGTDPGERWTVDQFRDYVAPYFSQGRGWTYVPRDRHVQLSPSGDVAWFDELLDNGKYGVCRGSGVLRRSGGKWLICQYNLSIPVPNQLMKQVTGLIRQAAAAPTPAPVHP